MSKNKSQIYKIKTIDEVEWSLKKLNTNKIIKITITIYNNLNIKNKK